MLDLKIDKLYDSGKEDEGQKFHALQVLRMKEDFWDKVRGLKGCEMDEYHDQKLETESQAFQPSLWNFVLTIHKLSSFI